MAFTAPCGCPSEGDERVSMTAHLPGCRFLEDLIEGSCCHTSEPLSVAAREPSDAEKTVRAILAGSKSSVTVGNRPSAAIEGHWSP